MRDPAADIRFEGASVVRTLRAPLPPDHFLHSDMAQRWVREKRLIDFNAAQAQAVVSRRVPFVSHPFEWCDAQLFGAAQLTLSLQAEAVASGRDLKDASAWNVIFEATRPVFCDLLSVVSLQEKKWWAMGQFARHFLLPLLLSKRRGLRAHHVFLMWRDGLPAATARSLLGPRVFFTRYAPLLLGDPNGGRQRTGRTGEGVAELVEPFRRRLHASLNWMLQGVMPPAGHQSAQGWAGYEDDRLHYGDEGLAKKRSAVSEWLTRLRPQWVTDLGCNAGEFSRMAAEDGAQVIAVDADHDCIQQLYRTMPAHCKVYPVIARLDDMDGGRGWAGNEHEGLPRRLQGSCDLVMALALLHHLIVGASVPMRAVAEFLHACTKSRAIVEVIDPADPQMILLCSQRQRSPDEFSLSTQRDALVEAGFDIEAEACLAPAKRRLLLLRKLS